MQAEFDAPAVVKSLIRRARRGALATRDAESGAPYASLVAVATDFGGAPLLLLSQLARHTRNLKGEPKASILIDDAALENPLAGVRATLIGRAEPVPAGEAEAARARYLARHPEAEGYAGFADFAFWRLAPDSVHLVAGFGRIQTLPWAQIGADATGAEGLLAAEAGAVAHMNEDHREALNLYATRLLGAPEGDWRCVGFDPEGMEMACGPAVLHLPFPAPVKTPAGLRAVLKELAGKARAIPIA